MIAFHHYWTGDEPFVEEVSDLRRMKIPDKHFYQEIGCGQRQREVMKMAGDEIAIIGNCSSATLAFLECMRGYDLALKDLILNPELVHKIMEKGVEIAIEKGKFNIDLGIKVLRLNDSIANMSVISPHHWREFILPHMKMVCDELHAYEPQVKIYCHICGNILPIVEDLVNTGLDCIGPLDPLGDFTPGEVRARVGDQVSLYGGVNTLSFVRKNPAEIMNEAKACILEAGELGGYVLGSGCVIPRNASEENLLALNVAAREFGNYQHDKLSISD